MSRNLQLGLLTGLIVLVTSFIIGEAGLRAFQYFARGTPFTTPLPGFRETRFSLSPFLTFGPRMDWQIPDRTFQELSYFNEQGFRTSEPVGPKDPDEFRIVALGGSTTENLWNELGIHWPLVLECELRAQGFSEVRVLNTGMSAYSSAQTLVRLAFDVLDYEPDLVLVMHNVNDLGVSYRAARLGTVPDGHYLVKYGDRTFTGDLDSRDVVYSRLIHAVRARLRARLYDAQVEPLREHSTEEGERLFARNLRSIIYLGRSEGTPVMLLTMPYAISLAHEESPPIGPDQVRMVDAVETDALAQDLDRFNSVIRTVASDHQAPLADMAATFGASPHHFVDLVHYSSEGIIRFGQLLSPLVADHLLSSGLEPGAPPPEGSDNPCVWDPPIPP